MAGERFDLDGRVAVVTGAGSGIGRAAAEALAGAGAVVVCADLDGDAATGTAATIADAGGAAQGVAADVTRAEDVERLVTDAVADHGRLDVMANIAGIMFERPVLETEEADLDRVLAVNLKGVFLGCRAAARVMVGQGTGSIVNMSSGAIDIPAPKLAAYGVAKAGVAQLTRVLATEVGRSGVRVNAVAPGFVLTAMTSRHFTAPDGTVDEERKAAVTAGFGRVAPLRRIGEPEDVAGTVLFLASDASSYMTGQILRPNGGVAMPW
jgi:3-oxoacyl-[acyl-carrier protein] reductase